MYGVETLNCKDIVSQSDLWIQSNPKQYSQEFDEMISRIRQSWRITMWEDLPHQILKFIKSNNQEKCSIAIGIDELFNGTDVGIY